MEFSAENIRPMQPDRDVGRIADLIELCFGSTMDADGREYLRQLRLYASSLSSPFGSSLSLNRRAARMQGLVWEENGDLIGNLTLIPFLTSQRAHYLIANVATHPDFQRRGIARQLTHNALQLIRSRGDAEAWLQVKSDNLSAYNLYTSIGFIEKARRTTWEIDPLKYRREELENRYITTHRIASDWQLQKSLLSLTYPDEISWNLSFQPENWIPGFWHAMKRFWNEKDIEHLVLRFDHKPVAFITRETTHFIADSLWLASDLEHENQAIRYLIPAICRNASTWRTLSLNYPAERSNMEFERAGLRASHTLIWMQFDYTMK